MGKEGKDVDAVVVNGFTILPIKFNKRCQACHYLYVKEHNVKTETDPNKPKDKTLFVVNVPPYCNEECLKRLFSDCGLVKNVILQKSPSSVPEKKDESQFFKKVKAIQGFKFGYVVFKKASSIEKAKSLHFEEPFLLSTEEHPIITGVKKWCQEYKEQFPDTDAMSKEIDQYMQDYDRKVEEEKQREKDLEGVPDEDGWVTVTRHGKNKGIPRTEAHEQRILNREKKKKKERELLNFYTFQLRDSKREHIAELRKQFEEDKQKIQLMKAQRKFKPY